METCVLFSKILNQLGAVYDSSKNTWKSRISSDKTQDRTHVIN